MFLRNLLLIFVVSVDQKTKKKKIKKYDLLKVPFLSIFLPGYAHVTIGSYFPVKKLFPDKNKIIVN